MTDPNYKTCCGIGIDHEIMRNLPKVSKNKVCCGTCDSYHKENERCFRQSRTKFVSAGSCCSRYKEKPPKGWGTEVFPMSEWIDPKKEYTCGGKRVIGIEIVLYNGIGAEVTYPVKGTIVTCEKPYRTTYAIWSLTGLADVVWFNGENLVEVKK